MANYQLQKKFRKIKKKLSVLKILRKKKRNFKLQIEKKK